jgi:hypothetical protein
LGHHTALDVNGEVLLVEFEHPVHLHQAKHDAAMHRHASAAQTGAGAARDDWNLVLCCVTDDLGHLGGRFRQGHAAGLGVKRSRAVKPVGSQVFSFPEQALRPKDAFKVCRNLIHNDLST